MEVTGSETVERIKVRFGAEVDQETRRKRRSHEI